MNIEKAQIFGLFLAHHRKERGLSFENIAKIAHCSISTVRNYENGVQLPEPHLQTEIARFFGYTKFIDNFQNLDTYRSILNRIESLMYHQKKDEVMKIIHQIYQNHENWISSYAFLLFHLVVLMEERYVKKDEQQFLNLIKLLSKGVLFYTPFEKYIFYEFQGDFFYQNEKYDKALSFWVKAEQFQPQLPRIHIQLAMIYQILGYQILSLQQLEIAKTLIFQNPDTYRFLQVCLIEFTYKIDEIESYYSIYDTRSNLYQACVDAGKIELSYLVLSNIAYMYLLNKDYVNSIAFSRKVLNSNDAPLLNILWFIPYSYLKMGLKSDCLLFIETYRDSAKKSSYILNMLELIKEFCLGNRKKGIQNLERLIAVSYTHLTLPTIGG